MNFLDWMDKKADDKKFLVYGLLFAVLLAFLLMTNSDNLFMLGCAMVGMWVFMTYWKETKTGVKT